MFDGHARKVVDRGVAPIGRYLSRVGVTPDVLTALGLAMSVATAITIGSGHTLVGFFLLLGSVFPDLFDGAVAKASGRASARGAFFDSVADRVTDGFLLGGIAWHLQSDPGGRAPMLALAVLGVSLLISYERAKAESLGYDAKGGLMERAERIIAICVGLVFRVMVPILWLMLILTSVTAVQRFVKVWRQASATVPGRTLGARHTPEWRRAARADRVRRSQQATRAQSMRNFADAWRERARQRQRSAR